MVNSLVLIQQTNRRSFDANEADSHIRIGPVTPLLVATSPTGDELISNSESITSAAAPPLETTLLLHHVCMTCDVGEGMPSVLFFM